MKQQRRPRRELPAEKVEDRRRPALREDRPLDPPDRAGYLRADRQLGVSVRQAGPDQE